MMSEQKAYEAYLDRLAMEPCTEDWPDEKCDAYNKAHPLPTKDELNRIMEEVGYKF